MAKYSVQITGEFDSSDPMAAMDTLISLASRVRNGEDVSDNLRAGENFDMNMEFSLYKDEDD